MLDAIILFSLKNRGLVLMLAAATVVYGVFQLSETPIDVLPDLNRPSVTVMTEAHGLAPEEVEVLVTRPLEYLLNGATGVKRVRSASGIGLSVVWVEFDWGTDIFRDRQIVNEKLSIARAQLPPDANPVLAPISSIMGEIMLLGLRSKSQFNSAEEQLHSAMELRTLAEFTIRNRLLAIDGVSQVTVMGGVLKQYQVLTTPDRLAAQNVTLQQLTEAAGKANAVTGGGILERGEKESLIRISGQTLTLEQIANTVVAWREPRPILISDVAQVRLGGAIRRGDGSAWTKRDGVVEGGTAVILAIQKQPHADTLKLDESIDLALDELQQKLPADAVIERNIFRQSLFIRSAVDNVLEAVRDGALWVVVVLFLFMWNFRVSVSSLTAMPISILLTLLIFRAFGVSINTMTLGGIAVAIGDLVDDSIVDIENIFRRLKLNQLSPNPLPPIQVVYQASSEVRNSIVYATLIVALVVLPLFALSGLEGRLFAPLGISYITSLMASLFVSLTVTPVLGSILLPSARAIEDERDPFLLRILKALTAKVLRFTLRHASLILVLTGLFVAAAISAIAWMGGEFLPPFNEGTLTITVQTEPGASLLESNRIAEQVQKLLLEIPEVQAVARRTGRAEADEHAEGVNSSDLEVWLQAHKTPRNGAFYAACRLIPVMHMLGYEYTGRDKEVVLADVRDKVSSVPGVQVSVGQPISHRLDHIMSGVRAQIAVKIFGEDLRELRGAAHEVEELIHDIPGVVDLQVEPQLETPQLRLRVKRAEAARFGVTPGDAVGMLETAYKGTTLSQIIEDDKYFDLVVWFDESARSDPAEIAKTILDTPSGRKAALGDLVEITEATGPNTINRENVQRRIVVSCNVQGRDQTSVVTQIEGALTGLQMKLAELPGNYRIELDGQFRAQREATFRLVGLGLFSVIGVFLLLCKALESWVAAVQVLVNIPLAAFGSVLALLVMNQPSWELLEKAAWWDWPRVWAMQTNLTLAHGVGFITLIGIVSRNGIMMISHYIHLVKEEGEEFGEAMIIRGSLERLAPVMMTALTSFMGLLPLLFGAGESGKEILHPLTVVVFGGMLASTLLDQIVTPALFYKFGARIFPGSAEAVVKAKSA